MIHRDRRAWDASLDFLAVRAGIILGRTDTGTGAHAVPPTPSARAGGHITTQLYPPALPPLTLRPVEGRLATNFARSFALRGCLGVG